MDSQPPSRRAFLGRLAAFGALGVSAPSLLTACAGDDAEFAPGVPIADATTCRGYDPASASVREALRYVDVSPNPDQYCQNCRFYGAPAQAGDRCGSCQVIPGISGPGPVSPGGYCSSWAAVVA